MNSKTKIVPVDATREFMINELFFSTTNHKGIISFGNCVFTRVSNYRADEMIGKPHNMIRHPDMPRAVFKLLWDYLLADKPIAAYVKNLASDGRYYWVLALAAPIDGGGFLSVRFKPSSELFAIISDVYNELRAIERSFEDRGEGPKAGMHAAEARLGEILQAKGFAGYEAFMQAMLLRELKSRDGILSQEQRTIFPPLPSPRTDEGPLGATLRTLYLESQQMYQRINALYSQLEEYAKLNVQLCEQSQAILSLTGEFRLICLNLTVTSSRLGELGRTLSVISIHLGDASTQVATLVSALATQATTISKWLGETIFNLSWARLQFEMVIMYYHEILTALFLQGSHRESTTPINKLSDLRFAFGKTIESTGRSLHNLAKELTGLTIEIEDLRKAMLSLQITYVGGLVEASRLTENGIFNSIFADVRRHIDATKIELEAFSKAIAALDALSQQTPEIMHTVSIAKDHMKHGQDKLATIVNSSSTLCDRSSSATNNMPLSQAA